VYYVLTGEVERRIIHELRKFWAQDQRYPDLVNNIQGKYRFDERPHYGMVVRVNGGDPVLFSADNYMGVQDSYVALAKVPKFNGTFLEWIREDPYGIAQNNGRFPSPPGVYYLQVDSYDPQTGVGSYYIDPLLDVRDEVLSIDRTGPAAQFTLHNTPIENSLRLFENPSGIMLTEGTDFILDSGTTYTFVEDPPTKSVYLADYKYAAPTTGPHQLISYQGTNATIPGVVLAFGNNVVAGDAAAVIIQRTRIPASEVYGGKWDISVDIEVISADKHAQMDITDRTGLYLHSVLRLQLSTEGLEMTNVSLGSQSEEVRDEAGEDYFYTASMSLSLQTDWELYKPLPFTLRAFNTDNISAYGYDAAEGVDLVFYQDPFFYTQYQATYPMIR
jgi:hypothetical protein